MNTNPDETKLAMWLDDELTGEELAAFEAWAAGQPEHFAAREESRRWRHWMAAKLPATEEPPYPDFFNSRVARAIQSRTPESPVASKSRFSWRSILMPLSACAGMVLAFVLGARTQPGVPEIDVTGAPRAIPVLPMVYTPENGVKAEWFKSSEAWATVIVLNGVQAIPDDTDFSKTASTDETGEINSTAESRQENPDQPES